MSRKTIEDLRAVLFATLDGLKDGSMEVERAIAINETGRTIVSTAKVEVDYMKQTGQGGTGFVPALVAPVREPSEATTATGINIPTPTGVVHRMRG